MHRTFRSIAYKVTLSFVSGFALCGTFAAADQVARATNLAIVDAMVFDGTGAAPAVRTVLIKDGRIAAIGQKSGGTRGLYNDRC